MPPVAKAYQVQEPRTILAWALLISLLLHLVLLPLLVHLSLLHSPIYDANLDDQAIFIENLESSRQLVELNQPSNSSIVPSDSRYLSDANRRVERQMQAQETGPLGSAQSTARAPEKTQSTTQETNRAEQKVSGDDGMQTVREESTQPKLNTKLSADWLASLGAKTPSNYLPNLELGNETLLNTREYAYAPFFIRMKQSLERVWNPQAILRNHGATMKDELHTVLKIVLNRDGSLSSVAVVTSSSIEALDREAVRAVQKAAPFINPPKDLVEFDGKITISNFHFIVSQHYSMF